jgi:flagellar hook-basal body complex protein FliE
MTVSMVSVTAGKSALAAAGATAPVPGSDSGDGFLKSISHALSDAAHSLQVAEATSSQALEGKASIQQVVDTVMHAERQLQTMLAIRDKIVGAYLEINRTTI